MRERALYVVLKPDGTPVPWSVRPQKRDAIIQAGRCCIGASEYKNGGADVGRRWWPAMYRRGFRAVRCRVVPVSHQQRAGE